jgi:hypothetical protein
MQKKGLVGGAAGGTAASSNISNSELVFVIETCQNCKEHHWNTRHDEAKYLDFFNRGMCGPKNEENAKVRKQ